MRCAIAKHDKDSSKIPKPPFDIGVIYKDYPNSFSHYSFEMILIKFNKRFPKIAIPKEIVDFRDAMAHGMIAEINNSWVNELVKFKQQTDKSLKVEFNMTLELDKLAQLRQSLRELRGYIIQELPK